MNFQKEFQALSKNQKKSGELFRRNPQLFFGQASLEFIILLAAGLAALGVIIVEINTVVETSDFALGTIQSRQAVQQITSAINTVSLLGNGNTVRAETQLSKGKLTLEIQNQSTEAKRKKLCATFDLLGQKKKTCSKIVAEIESIPKKVESGRTSFTAENKNGKITVKII